MSRRGSEFAGLSVAIVTPFKDGKIDSEKLKQQVEFQIAAGTDCIVPVGTTGESPTLSHPEHERVISEVIQVVAGRAKVMAGTGSNSTAEAISLTKWAENEGADATLQVAPYYNKPTQEGFYQHYKAIAEAVSLPICVYNIPGRCGKNIEPETIARMAEMSNIVMVKEATGSMDQASQVLSLTDLTLLSGDDSMTLPLLSIGGRRGCFRGRQHRPRRHDCHGQSLPSRRHCQGSGMARQTFPALPGPVEHCHQPDSTQSCDGRVGTGYR